MDDLEITGTEEGLVHLHEDPKDFGELMQLVGMVKRGETDKQFNTAVNAMTYKRIRESRLYRRLDLNWAQFCEQYLDCTKRHADEIIENLNTYGIEMLQRAEKLGISRSMFRQFRGLPEPEQAKVKELIEQGRINDLRDIYEEQLAEKEAEVLTARKEAEKSDSEFFKAKKEAQELEVALGKSRKVIEEYEYKKTQLKNDNDALAREICRLIDYFDGGVMRVKYLHPENLEPWQIAILYNAIRFCLDKLIDQIKEFEAEYREPLLYANPVFLKEMGLGDWTPESLKKLLETLPTYPPKADN